MVKKEYIHGIICDSLKEFNKYTSTIKDKGNVTFVPIINYHDKKNKLYFHKVTFHYNDGLIEDKRVKMYSYAMWLENNNFILCSICNKVINPKEWKYTKKYYFVAHNNCLVNDNNKDLM